MQICAILCLCLVNFVFESNAKTVPLNMQVPIVADFRMTNLKEYIDSKISKELKKASETESKVEKLEDIISSLRTKFKNMSEIQDTLSKQMDGINDTASNSETKSKVENLEDNLSSLRTKFKNMSEIQDTLSKQIDGINDTASETESKVEKLEATLSSFRTQFKNMSEIQDTLSKQMDGINDTDTVKSLTQEINKIKQLQDKNIKNIDKILNIVDNSSNELQDVFGQTFYLMFTPNIKSAQLLLASSTNGVCNLHKLGTSSGEKITLHDKSSIKMLTGTYNKQFKLHCNVSVKLFVLTQGHSTWIDSYIALPKRYLGTEYLIPSYTQATKYGPGTYLGIVSTKPTQVEIFGKDKRSKMFRKLSLDTEKSWYDYNNDRIDISGSYVKASTPVAVFSNIVCVKNNNNCRMFSDMVIPIRDYSKVFLIPHIKNVGKWTIRLYAKSTCNIKLFNKSRRQLFTKSVKNDTKFVEVQDGAMSSVVSSCPSMVQLYGHATGNSISYMVLVPGIDKYLSYYYFMVPNYTSSLYIMIKTVHMKEIRIDESTYSPKQYDTFQDPTNPSHKYAVFSVPVSAGRHEVRTINDAPFGLWIYGKGFGYPAGYGVKTL